MPLELVLGGELRRHNRRGWRVQARLKLEALARRCSVVRHVVQRGLWLLRLEQVGQLEPARPLELGRLLC